MWTWLAVQFTEVGLLEVAPGFARCPACTAVVANSLVGFAEHEWQSHPQRTVNLALGGALAVGAVWVMGRRWN